MLPEPQSAPERKNLWLAYVLWIPPMGIFGCHHYYLGRTWFGLFYTFFLGNFALGWIVDGFRMKKLVQRRNEELWMIEIFTVKPIVKELRYIDDCYILQFPLGIFGLVHAHLSDYGQALLYPFTFGGFLIMWLKDFAIIPSLVQEHNSAIEGYDNFVVNLERLKGGFFNDGRGGGIETAQQDNERNTAADRNTVEIGVEQPPTEGAPPSYVDVINKGPRKYPIIHTGSPFTRARSQQAGHDNTGYTSSEPQVNTPS